MPNNPLRRIEPVSIAGLKPRTPPTGQPIMEYVSPRSLYVDPAYQRSIGERGLRQIRRIIENFDWSKFKLPTCCYAENFAGETVLFVLDGQHTAIACASHPDIDCIPVQIVEAVGVEAQAEAFIGLNTDRLGVTKLQLHQAAVVAGDPEAVTIEQVCERAGVTILRGTPGSGRYKPKETIAVAALAALISRRGSMRARIVLDVLAATDLAPIASIHIQAVDLLLHDKEFCDQIAGPNLTTAINEMIVEAEDEAKLFGRTHKIPKWRALASVWFRKCRKTRATKTDAGKTQPSSSEETENQPSERIRDAPRTQANGLNDMLRPEIAQRAAVVAARRVEQNVTASVMGDPPAGRSALDQRKGTA